MKKSESSVRPPRSLESLRTRAPVILALLIGAAVAVDVSRSIGAIARGAHTASGGPAAAAASTAGPGFDLAAAGALFGRAVENGANASVERSADLELTGTVSLDDALRGLGIIRRHSEAEQTYRVGDALPGGALLAEVYATHVVIDAAGQRTTLWLPHATLGGAFAGDPGPRAKARDEELVAMSPEVPKTRAARMQRPINVPGSPIVRALHPRAVLADDHVLGYRMSSNGGGPAIPGLPLGALVREIDGVRLTDGVATARALQAMAARGTATFVIRAGDGEKSITLDVSHLGQLDP